MAYTKYSLTPANNNAAPPDGAPEGMLPSAVNDTMRDMMAQIRDCGDGIRGGTYTMTAPVITGGSINGTTVGASTASTGAFTTLAYTGTLTGGTGVVNIGSGQIYKDADGKVGIGTSSPDVNLRVTGSTATVSSQPNVTARFGPSVDSDLLVGSITGNSPFIASQGAYPLLMYTNATERMRIDSNGGVFIGGTTAYGGGAKLTVDSQGDVLHLKTSSSSAYPLAIFNHSTGALASAFTSSGVLGLGIFSGVASENNNKTGTFLQGNNVIVAHDNTEPTGFFMTYQYGGAVAGYIAGISGGASVQYVAVSDYRLKENVSPMVGALDTVAKLKPVTYTWKANGTKADGFIAHELQEVLPNAVSGEKDAVDKDGNIVAQGIDTSYVVATLTAAIQELKAELDSVKTELATLKA